MSLRESGKAIGEQYSLGVATRHTEGDAGVRHGDYLARLVDAVLALDAEGVRALKAEGAQLLGPDGLVEAIAVAAGFNGINRVADAIGVPLDERFDALDASFWAESGIRRATSAGYRSENGG